MTEIKAKLERIFEFIKKLNFLLDEEEYEQFLQQQELFGDLLKDFLSKHSENELVNVMEQLKRLKHLVYLLQERTESSFNTLKNKSLLLQRNKIKIKAYK